MQKLLSLFCLLTWIFVGNVSIPALKVEAAPPPLPSSYYGAVTLNGENVPEGTQITAWINGVQYSSTGAILYQGSSVYSLNVPGDITGTTEIEGGKPDDVVVFKIGGVVASAAGVWQSGTNLPIDLAAESSQVKTYGVYLGLLLRAP